MMSTEIKAGASGARSTMRSGGGKDGMDCGERDSLNPLLRGDSGSLGGHSIFFLSRSQEVPRGKTYGGLQIKILCSVSM